MKESTSRRFTRSSFCDIPFPVTVQLVWKADLGMRKRAADSSLRLEQRREERRAKAKRRARLVEQAAEYKTLLDRGVTKEKLTAELAAVRASRDHDTADTEGVHRLAHKHGGGGRYNVMQEKRVDELERQVSLFESTELNKWMSRRNTAAAAQSSDSSSSEDDEGGDVASGTAMPIQSGLDVPTVVSFSSTGAGGNGWGAFFSAASAAPSATSLTLASATPRRVIDMRLETATAERDASDARRRAGALHYEAVWNDPEDADAEGTALTKRQRGVVAARTFLPVSMARKMQAAVVAPATTVAKLAPTASSAVNRQGGLLADIAAGIAPPSPAVAASMLRTAMPAAKPLAAADDPDVADLLAEMDDYRPAQ